MLRHIDLGKVCREFACLTAHEKQGPIAKHGRRVNRAADGHRGPRNEAAFKRNEYLGGLQATDTSCDRQITNQFQNRTGCNCPREWRIRSIRRDAIVPEDGDRAVYCSV